MNEQKPKRVWPFIAEFARFAAGFAVIVAVALVVLRLTNTAL